MILIIAKTWGILIEKLEKTLLIGNQQQRKIIKSDPYIEQEIFKHLMQT